MIGSYTRKLIVARFAQTGEWCPTALLVFRDGVPEGVAAEAKRERSVHLQRRDLSPCTCAGCLFREVRGG